MAFERWQQQLHDLLTSVQTKQQQYDKAASACQVLLKPWPKKTQEKEQDLKKESLVCNENATSTHVDPQEEAELQLVNNLLKKAQKTRVKTASKKQDDCCPVKDDSVFVRSEKDGLDKNNSETSTPDSLLNDQVQSSNIQPTSVIHTNDKVKLDNGRIPTGKHVNKSERQRTQLSKQSEVHSSQRGSRPTERRQTSTSSANKRASIPDVKHPKSLESSRPISRPRSSRGGVKPAHTTAPFKTDPNLHVPKRSVKNSVHPGKRHTLDKHQNHVKPINHVNKVLPPITTQRDESPSLVSSVQEDSNLLDDCETNSPVSSRDILFEADTKVNSNCEDNLTKQVSGLTLTSGPGQDIACKPYEVLTPDPEVLKPPSEEKQETKLFSLLTDGSSVNIPARVRRAFAKNHQVRKKVVQQQTGGTKPRPAHTNKGQKFADKLQQLFDPEEELIYRQQALECLRTHQQLLQLLTDLKLDELTEASSAKDVLRSKMLAEFVLSSFSAFSDDVAVLSKVQFPATVSVAEPSHQPTGPMHLWLPVSLQGENLQSSERLQYTSKTQLTQYVNVLLHLQTLKCQHYLLDILVTDVLPWLQDLGFQHQDFGTIFRGLFALLTSDGSQLPVLIHSSLE